MYLIYILILIFVIFISYQIIIEFTPSNIIEGLENTSTSNSGQYKPYNSNDPNNALILAQQNAGNIEVLNGRVNNLDGIKQKVDDMQQEIDSMQVQIDGLVQQQADLGNQLVGSEPPTVSGTEPETAESVENSIEEEDN